MRNAILLPVLLAAVLAPTARAACVDTLYLNDLTVFHMSVGNSKVLGTWDTLSVNPWTEDGLKLANEVSHGTREWDFIEHSLQVAHPRTVYYRCGDDGHSEVEDAVVTDSFWTDTRTSANMRAQTVQSSTYSTGITKASNIYYTFQGAKKTFVQAYLDSVDYTLSVGRPTATDPLQAWSASVAAYYFTPAHDYPQDVTVPGRYPSALKDYAWYTADSALAALSGYVDVIPSQVDSTRMEVKVFRYTYDFTKPSAAVHPGLDGHLGYSVRAVSGQLVFSLDRAASVRLVRPDGSVAASFEASQGSSRWTPVDAAGLRLSGLYLAQVGSRPAVPVLLR
jgi:hypothetical protein